MFSGFDFDSLFGLKMKGYYNINKSLNNEDFSNEKILFIDYMKDNVYYNKKDDDNKIIMKNKQDELFDDF